MALVAGKALAHYSILAPIGSGAMGEVWRARDTRLGREVAIKVLPEHFVDDEERLGRFEREAKTLASLNHPNVAQIFGVDRDGDLCFLVLELVPGESLEERLKRGPLPVDEAIDVCRQIAEGLEAAHEAGVIHRDLKPANVRLTPEGKVKLLDFGLAKAAGSPSDPKSTTDSVLSTEAGRLLGTPTYMAPEQARGKPIDKRVDVWAFGCVLYECLTATRAFGGETLSDVLAAVLEKTPDLSKLPAATPRHVRTLLARCLDKDPRRRLRDVGEARLALEGGEGDVGEAAASSARRSRREIAAWTIAAAALIGSAAGWIARRERSHEARGDLVRFLVSASAGTELEPSTTSCAISADGCKLAFLAREPGKKVRLYVRDLDSLVTRPLEGTEGADMPFWSPTGDAIAFFADGRLSKVAATGGAVQSLCDAPAPRGGSWSESGTIVFAPLADGPLHAVPQSGGTSVPVTGPKPGEASAGHRFPQFLPGGRRFLYADNHGGPPGETSTVLGSLDSMAAKPLMNATSRATFAPPDWLLADQDGVIVAQRFDVASGALLGNAIPTGIQADGSLHTGGSAALSCSQNGVVASIVESDRRTRLVELDRRGAVTHEFALEPDYYTYVSFSHAGDRAAVGFSRRRRNEVRVADLAREGVWSRLTAEPFALYHVWSWDDQWVYFTLARKSRDVFRCPSAGGRAPELVLESDNAFTSPRDLSADGKELVFSKLDSKNQRDLWILNLESKQCRPLLATPGNECDARFSPDGKWIAYVSDDSGRAELYVQAFPEVRTRVRVSSAGVGLFGGGGPADSALIHWGAGGDELVYLDGDLHSVVAVPVSTQPALQVGSPHKLFDLPRGTVELDLSRDGQRVLVLVPDTTQPPCSLSVTTHWTAELEPR